MRHDLSVAEGNSRIDERLAKLVDRYEALALTVEHLALQGEEQNKRIEQLVGVVETLAHVAESHERRLSNLEGSKG